MKYRDVLVDALQLEGSETVLDAGCGRGLVAVEVARKLSAGKVIAVDVWLPGAITENSAEAVRQNAAAEGVSERVEVRTGDVRHLPVKNGETDAIASNFVLHELETPTERARIIAEFARALKPGGRLAVVDFNFTRECTQALREAGFVAVSHQRFTGIWDRIGLAINFGLFRPALVTAHKPARE